MQAGSSSVLPLPVSIHQDPYQNPGHCHQDGVVVHTLQTCGSKGGGREQGKEAGVRRERHRGEREREKKE